MAQGRSALDAFMDALIGQESGGDATAQNERTAAFGLGQIMPENWEPWALEAGVDPTDYSEANQRRIIRYKLGQYYDSFGTWEDVASAWYSGQPRSAWSQDTLNRAQGYGNEPSINEYIQGVIGRMGEYSATPTTTVTKRADGFTEPFGSNLDRLLADFGGKVTITSGFRSQDEQQYLWDNSAQDGIMVAPPATEFDADGNALNGSFHGRGMAADLGFADDATQAAVHAQAASYSLWFPMDYEPWHIEPIGSRDGTYKALASGSSIQGITGKVGSVVDSLNPLNAASSVISKLAWFTDFNNLFRVMQAFAGVSLLIGGFVLMVSTNKTVLQAARTGASAVVGTPAAVAKGVAS